jgi:hypothetical protein
MGLPQCLLLPQPKSSDNSPERWHIWQLGRRGCDCEWDWLLI